MTLTARDIAEITRLLEDSSFDELEIEIDGMKIHLRRGGVAAPRPAAETPILEAVAPQPAPQPADPNVIEVRAPLLGTFYRAPKPGAPPFVEEGARVESDTVIGIIEVMKLMNSVRAGARGVVRSVRARDGELVEFGQALLSIDTRVAP